MRLGSVCRPRISLLSINLIILANLSLAMYIPENLTALKSNMTSNKSIGAENQKSRILKIYTDFLDVGESERNENEVSPPFGYENQSYNTEPEANSPTFSADGMVASNISIEASGNSTLESPSNATIYFRLRNGTSKHRTTWSISHIRKKRQVPLETGIMLQRPLSLSTRSVVAPRSAPKNKPFTQPNTCPPVKKNVSRTLGCYQCNFTYVPGKRQNGEQCDDKLWGITSTKEKHVYRIRCPEEGGHFCVKKVQEKAGGRVTLRGCMGPGPIMTEHNESIRLQEGCVSYRQGGYTSTACLCSKDMCNAAPRVFEGILHSLFVTGMSFFVFYFSLLVLQTQA